MSKSKFQVGDRVKLSERAPKYLQEIVAGREGTVIHLSTARHGVLYEVEYRDGGRNEFVPRELTLVEGENDDSL